MAGPTQPGTLASALALAAGGCEEAVSRYLVGRGRQPGLHFSRPVTLAIAILAEYGERPTLSEEDIQLIGDACADAAAACRSEPPERTLIVAAGLFADVTHACAVEFGATPAEPGGREWLRFLFADADVEVAREAGRWHVRNGTTEVDHKLLDEALAELLSLANHRLGELTVQILLWYSRLSTT